MSSCCAAYVFVLSPTLPPIIFVYIGAQCLERDDALQHLLNYVWPNIFETSPHLVQSFFDAIDGFRVSLGPWVILQYLLQGLFHPARKVSVCVVVVIGNEGVRGVCNYCLCY